MTPRRDRTTLEARLAAGPLAPGDAAALAADLASALAALHGRGDVHGAVRPDAIVLAGGRAALGCGLPSSAPEPGDAAALARAGYAAPEVLRGRPMGPAADLFGLGVVLHEALGGAHPFRSGEGLETVRRILHEAAPPLAAERPDVPRALAELVDALLAKAPRRRPSARKVAEAAARVRAAMEAPTPPVAAAHGPAPIPRRSASLTTRLAWSRFRFRFRRRRWRTAHRSRRLTAAVAAALLVGGLAIRSAWRHHQDAALSADVLRRLDARDLAGAQRLLRDAERRRPGDAVVTRLQGDVALARGDARRALRLWRSALASDRRLGGDPRLRQQALSLLPASDGRADLVGVLAALDRDVVDPLAAATRSRDARVRWNAVRALEARGEAGRVDYAQVYLADLEHGASCTARRAAAAKLTWLRSPEALPGLERARAGMGLFDRLCMGDAVDRAIDATRRGPPRA